MSNEPTKSPVVTFIEAAIERFKAANAAKNVHEAEGIADDLLARFPNDPNALFFKGLARAANGHPAAAIEYGKRALAIGNVPQWHGHLAAWYRLESRLDLAAEHARLGVTHDVTASAEARLTLANVLVDMGQHEEAEALILGVIGALPQWPEPRMHLAQILLARGVWRPGWLAYEDRNSLAMATELPGLPALKTATWNGMPLPKGRLVVVGDQGFGDTIQFLRFLPRVAELCKEVYLGVSTELYPLVSRSIKGMARIDHQYDRLLPPQGANAHVRMTSLGHYLGVTDENIPTAPYLSADPAKVAAWRGKLPAFYPKVGIVWAGRPTHPNDQRRSMALEALLPLADTGVHFVSLQQGVTESNAALLERFPGAAPLTLTNYDDTAAVIENLDLVVAVDTSVVHLAGAMGKPVWIMLPKTADWRWMTGGNTSIWYPTARLYRQPEHGEWGPVVQSIARALRAMASGAPPDSLQEAA